MEEDWLLIKRKFDDDYNGIALATLELGEQYINERRWDKVEYLRMRIIEDKATFEAKSNEAPLLDVVEYINLLIDNRTGKPGALSNDRLTKYRDTIFG